MVRVFGLCQLTLLMGLLYVLGLFLRKRSGESPDFIPVVDLALAGFSRGGRTPYACRQ